MVIAGTKNIKMKGIIEKTLLSEELSARNISLVKNQPVKSRKTDMTI